MPPAEAARASLRLSTTNTAPGGQSSIALRCGCWRFSNTLIGLRSSRAGMKRSVNASPTIGPAFGLRGYTFCMYWLRNPFL